MGAIYTATFSQAINVAADLVVAAPADDKVVTLRGLVIGQSTEYAEQSPSQAEQLGLSVLRGATAGTGATTLTPQAADTGNSTAMGATVTGYSTAAGSGGTAIFRDAFNVQAGYQFFWVDDLAPTAKQGDTNLVIRLDAAPADSITFSVTAFYEET